jgi:hypothetical protein
VFGRVRVIINMEAWIGYTRNIKSGGLRSGG